MIFLVPRFPFGIVYSMSVEFSLTTKIQSSDEKTSCLCGTFCALENKAGVNFSGQLLNK